MGRLWFILLFYSSGKSSSDISAHDCLFTALSRLKYLLFREFKWQVEFNELEEGSKLAINIAWDDSLRWPWEKAMEGLHDTMDQVLMMARDASFDGKKIASALHVLINYTSLCRFFFLFRSMEGFFSWLVHHYVPQK